MKTTTENEIKVSGAKVTNATVMPDGTCKLTIEIANAVSNVTEVKDDEFILVEASKLSMNDEFMQVEPGGDRRLRQFKNLLAKAIKSGLKDFKRPKYDPSFNEEGGICYEPGKDPAILKSYNWWNQEAKKFKPEYNSRLGTKTEYVAFLGVLIKQLVEMGWDILQAWYAVCINSESLGNYYDTDDPNEQRPGWYLDDLEPTGSKGICGFYDLANCHKILAKDKQADGFYFASGCSSDYGRAKPLAWFCLYTNQEGQGIPNITVASLIRKSVGWLVLD